MPNTLPVSIKTVEIRSDSKKRVLYPQIIGMQNEVLQKSVNNTIAHETQQLIDQQVGSMPTTVEEMLGSFEIKNNQREILSLTLSNYTYHYHAAHGLTILKSLTFDLHKEKPLEIKDLFKPGSDYVKSLSSIIQTQIKQRGIFLINGFTVIRPNQDFYIADKALVIYFQLYEITPYAFGFPMFPISVFDIQDIIDENGLLGRMAVNH